MPTPLEQWVEEQAALTKPDRIVFCDGSEEEARRLIGTGLSTEKLNGQPVFREINDQVFPQAYYHRSHPNDVARVEHLTYVNHPDKDMAGPNNNWMDPAEAKALMRRLFDGCMRGRTMYVMPYLMGHPDSPYSKTCVQITDSTYVAVSMRIMTRLGRTALEKIGDRSDFVKGLHSVGELDPAKRYIMHFPQEHLVMSIGSGYGGNALLGKKCFSLRIASCLGRSEGWLAEHMIVAGVGCPDGKTVYLTGAFPSACGKTNLAMLDPTIPGYTMETLGDDIAWLNPGPDGTLRAINPEMGFFGVAPMTAMKTNPNMMKALKTRKFFPTLFTNTGLDLDTRTPWWEGMEFDGSPVPSRMEDWQGRPFDPQVSPAAHANSRFTVSAYNAPTLSPRFDDPSGVPVSIVIFGVKRTEWVPLVFEAFSWKHAVFCASVMGSETTAAASGGAKVGTVRRDPMAMLPFCGYNMADYFGHWLAMGPRLSQTPRIFFVNWFRKDENGKFLWPGFRENIRIIKWMIDRVNGKVGAVETPLGLVPKPGDLDLTGLSVTPQDMEKALAIDKEEWKAETAEMEKFYETFGDRLPGELREELAALKKRLA